MRASLRRGRERSRPGEPPDRGRPAASGGQEPPEKGTWGKWAVVAVMAVAFAVYAGALSHELVWDDLDLVRNARQFVREGGIARLLASDFVITAPTGYYRPVVLLSLWLDSVLSSRLVPVFHLTNALLHAAATGLVFHLLALVLGSRRAAFFGALLFAVHPVHTESVAFASGRTDLWAAVFALGAVILWARARERTPRRPRLEQAAGGVSLLAAVLSKEVAFLVPAVVLAWDALWAGGETGGGWWLRNRWWLLSWGLALGIAVVLRTGVAGVGWGRPVAVLPGGEAGGAPGWLALWTGYFRLLVVPWPLNAYYRAAQVRLAWAPLLGAGALGALCAVTAPRSARRAGLLAAAWIVGFLVPVAGTVPLNAAPMAERFLYLPSVGFCLAWGAAIDLLIARSRRLRLPAAGLAGVVSLVMAAGTVARVPVWKDPIRLFEDMIRTSPDAPMPYNNLGNAYGRAGRYSEALQAYQQAILKDKRYAEAYYNLGSLWSDLRDPAKAIEAFGEATRLEPGYAEAFYNLGNAYRAAGDNERALEAYRQAARLQPGRSVYHNNLGAAYAALGRYGDALQGFREATRLDPENARAHFNYGLASLRAGDRDTAVAEQRLLEGLDPGAAAQLLKLITSQRSP